MTRALKTTRAFEKDLKRAKRCGKKLVKLWSVVEQLLAGEPLSARHRPHKLSGDWAGFWECPIESDWLLIWLDEESETIVLVCLGSHSDLFR